ncbi:Caspase-3 precursor, putative [Pediculus humanus corporis]|uniref:Caspase-3, putative n=1 Tax=Pediculus humanus subsp. corporis TaxID=121224 RepID=E0VT85_PEDHC|nr:Caspase-3 precursor, putative [Pediculus humanus corporis]EEB16591.1 Caspase-3 precursor, putative [Pediculus humanus corporis]
MEYFKFTRATGKWISSYEMLKIHRDAILSNLSTLVEETDLNKLVPDLLNKNVFNERMINRILNPSHNGKRQKTDLYTEILKRGPLAFANLKNSLNSTGHLKLAQILSETEMKFKQSEIGNSSMTSPDSCLLKDGGCISIDSRKIKNEDFVSHKSTESNPSVSSNNTSNLDIVKDLNDFTLDTSHVCTLSQYPEYMKDLEEVFEGSEFPFTHNVIAWPSERFLPVKVKYASNFKELKDIGPPTYKMDSNPRGFALIVNNIDFDDSEEYKTRYGADNDEYRLKLLLEQLFYVVEVHRNKTKKEMLEITNRFSQRDELNECDSVVVTFMSHGEEGDTEDNSKIVGIDGLTVAINDIVGYFYNDACKALIHKPKMFFFQACRGILEDTGVVLENYIPTNRIEKDSREVRDPPRKTKIRSQSDIFIACPVPPGRKANRDRVTGTWFIQTIIDVFSEHSWNTHLEDMMKMVNN